MIDLSAPGWKENTVYPGTHWLFHDQRGNYRARVDRGNWTYGRYQWRVMRGWPDQDITGFAETLEEAQVTAEQILRGAILQLKLM